MPEVPLLVVDAANVVGSVPDGWWRDRYGAAVRLRDTLAPLAATGLPGVVDPGVPAPGVPGLAGPVEVVLVVEGAARDVPSRPEVGGPRTPETTDRRAGRRGSRARRWVVTADRELRDRVTAPRPRPAPAIVRPPPNRPR
jgi:hypothetical protein